MSNTEHMLFYRALGELNNSILDEFDKKRVTLNDHECKVIFIT